MTEEETVVLCNLTDDEFEEGELFALYQKGRLEAELAVRRSLVQKAQDGDSSAQKEFLRMAEARRQV
jgi:hypothetical protein